MLRHLIVAPHADDESLGCGGLIATDPSWTVVAVLADKDDGRMEEFRIARKELGYGRYLPPRWRTGDLADNMRDLVGHLDGIVREMKPHTLLLPAPGTHQDHIAAYEAGMRAARLSYTSSAWFVPEVLLYDVPGYATDLYTTPYRWNRFRVLSLAAMRTKQAAIRAYSSQSMGSHDPAALALSHAQTVGQRIGQQFAEQYAVVRSIEGIR